MEKETIKIDDDISFNLSMEAFEIKQNIENVVTPKKMRTSSIVTSEICLNESYTKGAKTDSIDKSAKNEFILVKDVNIDAIAKSAKNEAILAKDANTDFPSISAKNDYILAKSTQNDSITKLAKLEYIAEDAKSAKND